jgi:hypothetical protein
MPYSSSGSASFYDTESGASISIRFTDAQCAALESLIKSFLPALCDQASGVLLAAKADMLALPTPRRER